MKPNCVVRIVRLVSNLLRIINLGAIMHPYLISLTSWVCQVLRACPASSQSSYCNQCERFLFFLCCHFKRAWHICQCWTQWRVNTYSTQPHQHCLWPSGKIISHPKSATLPPISSISLCISPSLRLFSLICLRQKTSLAHFVSSSHSLDTHMHTKTHRTTYTERFRITASHIPLTWHHSP